MYIICGAPHCTNVLVIITQNGYSRKGGIDGPAEGEPLSRGGQQLSLGVKIGGNSVSGNPFQQSREPKDEHFIRRTFFAFNEIPR